jgi:hypothetical protein
MPYCDGMSVRRKGGAASARIFVHSRRRPLLPRRSISHVILIRFSHTYANIFSAVLWRRGGAPRRQRHVALLPRPPHPRGCAAGSGGDSAVGAGRAGVAVGRWGVTDELELKIEFDGPGLKRCYISRAHTMLIGSNNIVETPVGLKNIVKTPRAAHSLLFGRILRRRPFQYPPYPISLAFAAIFEATRANIMNATSSFMDAERVVLSGCSAGGLAT